MGVKMAAIQKQVQMRDILLFSLFCLSQISAVRSSSVESSHHISKRTVKHHGVGYGSSCTVKGSYCSCHYCRCDHGFIHCVKHGATAYHHGIGKNYCYGHMEGETVTVITASASMDTENMVNMDLVVGVTY